MKLARTGMATQGVANITDEKVRRSFFVGWIAPVGFLTCLACQSPSTSTSNKASVKDGPASPSQPVSDFRGVRTVADIGNFEWVNKQCRLWGADGDIDVDQTCLVVRNVRGNWVVIPNEYVDTEFEEISGEVLGERTDKWIQRFIEIRFEGEKLNK